MQDVHTVDSMLPDEYVTPMDVNNETATIAAQRTNAIITRVYISFEETVMVFLRCSIDSIKVTPDMIRGR